MAEGDPSQRARIDHLGDRLAHRGEHRSHPGMKQQRLAVADEELVELHIDFRRVAADTEDVGGDFYDRAHGGFPRARQHNTKSAWIGRKDARDREPWPAATFMFRQISSNLGLSVHQASFPYRRIQQAYITPS